VLLGRNWVTSVSLTKPSGWVEIQIGSDDLPEVNRVEVDARVLAQLEPENWTLPSVRSYISLRRN